MPKLTNVFVLYIWYNWIVCISRDISVYALWFVDSRQKQEKRKQQEKARREHERVTKAADAFLKVFTNQLVLIIVIVSTNRCNSPLRGQCVKPITECLHKVTI